MGPTTAIVISSPKLAREYMDLRGSTTSDRPPVYVDKLISDNLEFALTPYGQCNRDLKLKLSKNMVFIIRPHMEKYAEGSTRYVVAKSLSQSHTNSACRIRPVVVRFPHKADSMLLGSDTDSCCHTNSTLGFLHTYKPILWLCDSWRRLWYTRPHVSRWSSSEI